MKYFAFKLKSKRVIIIALPARTELKDYFSILAKSTQPKILCLRIKIMYIVCDCDWWMIRIMNVDPYQL